MSSLTKFTVFMSLILCSGLANAQSIPLQNISPDDMNKVVGDFSTNFLHTSVSGAGILGHVFGFELGLVGGQTNTPHLNEVAAANAPAGTSVDAGKLYNVSLLGAVSVPFGITAEIGLVPKVGPADFRYSASSAAVKWTPTEVFSDLPVSLAGKISFTTNELDFSQNVGATPIDYTYKNSEIGYFALVSKDLAIFEPYFGLGYVSAKGTLSATSSSVFASGATSDSATRNGTAWMVGTEIKLLVFKAGVEYMNLFSTSRVMGKLSFYF